MVLLNALPGMLLAGIGQVELTEISAQDAGRILCGFGVDSFVGHADTAQIFADLLGVPVPVRRESVTSQQIEVCFQWGSVPMFIAGLYNGPRLPEGAKTLPEGAEIKFFVVALCDNNENGFVEDTSTNKLLRFL